MKFQYQTRSGSNGDCMRACIATLLEVPILSVPDFTEIPEPEGDPEAMHPAWYLAMQSFVLGFGFSLIEIQLDGRKWIPIPNATLCIFKGPSPDGTPHAIVGRLIDDAFEPIFNPLGDEKLPITSVEEICFLVPCDPMTVCRMGNALQEIEASSRGIPNRILGDSICDTAREGLGKKRHDTPTIFGPGGVAVESRPETEKGNIIQMP